LLVRHALTAAILRITAFSAAGITSRLSGTQVLACSSVCGLGRDRASAVPEHLNRRPSVRTNVHELTAAAALEPTVDEQLAVATARAVKP
jgi:hypothetical protein